VSMRPRHLAALLLAAPAARAGLEANCLQGWNNKARRLKDSLRDEAGYTDLSGCQASLMFDGDSGETNNILVGGKGSAEIIGITAGSGGAGCTGGDSCMKFCQAFCCLANGCQFAELKRKEDTDDYVVYTETSKMFYCRMIGAIDEPEFKSAENKVTCWTDDAPASDDGTCADVVSEALGMDENTYASMKALAAYDECPAGVGDRRMLFATNGSPSQPSFERLPGRAALVDAISTNGLNPEFKAGLKSKVLKMASSPDVATEFKANLTKITATITANGLPAEVVAKVQQL